MSMNQFHSGRLHHRCRCPGLTYHRRSRKSDWDRQLLDFDATSEIENDSSSSQSETYHCLFAGWLLGILHFLIHLSLVAITASFNFLKWLLSSIWLELSKCHHDQRHNNQHHLHINHLQLFVRIFLFGITPLYAQHTPATDIAKQGARKAMATSLLSYTLALDDIEDVALKRTILHHMKCRKIAGIRRKAGKNRVLRVRKKWSDFEAKLTDRQFRRYFRMSRECFELLCDSIKENVGERTFKSESYLNELRNGFEDNTSHLYRFSQAHDAETGGFISGEIKVALTLRLLAGGSYLDLALLFETGFTYAYAIFHDVIQNWILDDRLVKISGIDYCSDKQKMRDVAVDFSRHSNGVLNGCIGALDGWVVKIMKPSKRDNVRNPASFFSRKGFFGINVQAIVDKKK